MTNTEIYCLSFPLSDLNKNKKFLICSKQVQRVMLTWGVHAWHALALTCSRPALQRRACAVLWWDTRGQCVKIKSWELRLQEALRSLFPMTLFLTWIHSRESTIFALSPWAARGCSVTAELQTVQHREQRDLSVSSTLMQTSHSGCEPNKTVNYIWFA